MPWDSGEAGPGTNLRGGQRAESGDATLRLLRDSHIFASAIREVLEVKLLREISPDPLTTSQFQALRLMALDGHHQLGKVADFLGVSPPAATKNIDKLERLGLVVRAPSKGDRRATLLSVSPKGRRLVRKYEQRKAACLGPVLRSFRATEITQFADLLERFSVSLLGREPSAERFCLRCAGYIEPDCPVSQVRGGCRYQQARHVHASRSPAEEV